MRTQPTLSADRARGLGAALVVTIALALCIPPVQADPPPAPVQAERTAATSDDPERGSTRNPASVEGELRQIYAPREPRAPIRGFDRALKPWYDLKTRLAKNIGLRFGIAYTPLYQVATDTLTGVDQSAGAMFEVLGTWNVLCRSGPRPGTLGFRLETRHKLWTEVAPQFLFLETGAGLPTATGYSEFDFSLAELWWEQHFVKDRVSIRIGKILPFGYHDFFVYKNPKTAFTNAAFSLNPTIAWPQFGLGALAEVRPREDIYISGGVHDANGDPERSGFDTFFDDQEYFVIGEIGWDPGFLADGKKNPFAPDFHVTLWHTDARTKAGRPDGWGFSVTGQKPFGDLMPFFRYGYSEGGAALLEHLVMGGVAWNNVCGYKQDTLGFAAAWGRPSNQLLDDQLSTELYYKMQFTRRLALTPSVQVLVNPSLNPDRSVLAFFGLRARIDL